ncbi:hypothetical protein NMY22_g5662 [Coprinellus aureogranulatus]|nr:hypothetical protein NMY22_g5662 [Coprinellus aureogranulatus]
MGDILATIGEGVRAATASLLFCSGELAGWQASDEDQWRASVQRSAVLAKALGAKTLSKYKGIDSLTRHSILELTPDSIHQLTDRWWGIQLDPILAVDTAVWDILAMQLNLVAGTIAMYVEERPDLRVLLDRALRFEVIGLFCLTEVQGGFDARNLETTATQLPGGGFDLHTPHERAAKFMAPTAPCGLPGVGIVFARLVVDGKDCGVRSFVVDLSDGDKTYPGVTVRIIQGRAGCKQVKHSITSFHHVKLPQSALLGSLENASHLSARGSFNSQLWRVSAGAISHAGLLITGLKISCVIAGKYSQGRTVAGTSSHANEHKGAQPPVPYVSIISFGTQHRPIVIATANAFVLQAFYWRAARFFSDSTHSHQQRHAIGTIFKMLAQRMVQADMLSLSERCGAQGLFAHNQIVTFLNEMRGVGIAEGDALVLSIRLVSELVQGKYDLPQPRDPMNVLHLHEEGMFKEVVETARTIKHPRSDGFNRLILPRCEKITLAIGHRMAYEAAVDAGLSPLITNLYQASAVQMNEGWFAEKMGYSREDQFRDLDRAVQEALPHLDEWLGQLDVEEYVSAPIVHHDRWMDFFHSLEIAPSHGSVGVEDAPALVKESTRVADFKPLKARGTASRLHSYDHNIIFNEIRSPRDALKQTITLANSMDEPALVPFPVARGPSSSENRLYGIEEMQESAHETQSSKLTSSDKLSALPTLPTEREPVSLSPQRWPFQRNYRHSLDAAVSLPAYAINDLEVIRDGGTRDIPSFRATGSGHSSPGPGKETPKQRVSFDSDRESHAPPWRAGQAFAKLVGSRASNPSASPHPHSSKPNRPPRCYTNGHQGSHRNHRHAKEEPFVPVNPFKMKRRRKKFNLSGMLSPPPSPDVEGGASLGSSSSGALECEDVIPVANIKALLEDVRIFLMDTLLRQLYLNILLRLPAMYFGRVARIFEDAEVSRPEIQRMIDVMCKGEDPVQQQPEQDRVETRRDSVIELDEQLRMQSGPTSPVHATSVVHLPLPFPDEWTPTSVSPSLFRFKHSWEAFIDSLIREWKTLNVVSALLSSAILSIFQVQEAAEDPVTRTLALLSLVSALMSLSYGCMYIVRFSTMRSMFRASKWAEQAQKTKTLIWWNVWVMLAMPVVWMSWAMLFFLSSIMSFVWRTGSEDDPEVRPPLPRKAALGPRIAITAVLALGFVYLFMIIRTLKQYGSGPQSLQGLLHIGQVGSREDRATATSGEAGSSPRLGLGLARIRTPESDVSERRGRARGRREIHEHVRRSRSLRRKGSLEKVEIEEEEEKDIAIIDRQITWSLPFREDDLTPEEVVQIKTAICAFSDSPETFEWFKARGYILFERYTGSQEDDDYYPLSNAFRPRIPSERSAQRAEYPFPHRSKPLPHERETYALASFPQFCGIAKVISTFGHLACISKADSAHDHRWGASITLPTPQTLKDILTIFHSMLKALNFLHSHNIAHMDIAEKNMLVDQCSFDWDHDAFRNELRSSGQLSYAMIDFDISIAFTSTTGGHGSRPKSDRASNGSWSQPEDARHGEEEFDPFAFDVECMGILFCKKLQAFTADIPFLAPLLDGMTAVQVSRRFTAAEALRFFETYIEDVPSEALYRPFKSIRTKDIDKYDRWSAIPVELARKWAAYREPLTLSEDEST